MGGRKGDGKPIADPLTAVEATILRLEQMEDCAHVLRLTAPRAMAELGDLSRRMRPTAVGFLVEMTVEEWEAVAIEHQCKNSGKQIS